MEVVCSDGGGGCGSCWNREVVEVILEVGVVVMTKVRVAVIARNRWGGQGDGSIDDGGGNSGGGNGCGGGGCGSLVDVEQWVLRYVAA